MVREIWEVEPEEHTCEWISLISDVTAVVPSKHFIPALLCHPWLVRTMKTVYGWVTSL